MNAVLRRLGIFANKNNSRQLVIKVENVLGCNSWYHCELIWKELQPVKELDMRLTIRSSNQLRYIAS